MSIMIVSTTAQLIAALGGAATGDVIKLAPGIYSNVNISNKSFSVTRLSGPSQVYIESEFSSRPATLTDMNIQKSQGLALVDLNFSTVGDPIGSFGAAGTTPFQIGTSSNISMRGITVSGDPKGTLANTISGMYIHSSSYVTVTASSFSHLHFAIDQFGNNHVNVTNNSFSHLFDDGVRGGGTSNINISGNTFTDLHSDPTDTDHPDCIQFWTTNTTTSASNITITNNTYTRGTGGAVQGIFLGNELSIPYDNVTVQGNNFTGTLWNGIDIGDVNGGTVSGNTVNAYSDYQAGIRVYGSKNIAVINNRAAAYSYTGSTQLTLSNNVVIPSIGPDPDVPDAHAAVGLLARRASTDSDPSPDLGPDLGPEIGPDASALSPSDLLNAQISAVPEPQSWALMSMALAMLGLVLRGRRYSSKVAY